MHQLRRGPAGLRPSHKVRARYIAPVLTLLLALALALPPAVLGALGLSVVPDVGTPGQTLTATATGFPANQPVTFWWDGGGAPIVVVANGAGTATTPIVIPASAAIGTHYVRACQGTSCPPFPYIDDAVTVVAPTPPPTASPAPTPAPTRTPTPTPTPAATPTPASTTAPAPTPDATVTPTATASALPLFPFVAPTVAPTPLVLVAVTPAPPPPDGLAASPGPFPDLEIRAVEVTQGIQNLTNLMPLVADRRTYVRVHLDVDGALELAHTYGALEARRDGQQIGWIWPENGPITARAGGGNRLDLDDSLYFRLPSGWLQGTVTLRAFVYSHDPAYPWSKEPEWQDNLRSVEVTFHEADPVALHLVPVHLHRSFHPTDEVREYEPPLNGPFLGQANNLDLTRIVAGMWRYHPISGLSVDFASLPVEPLDHDIGDEWDLGDCRTIALTATGGLVQLADWRPLMDDPTVELTVDVAATPDRPTVYVQDWVYEIDHFYPHADGSANAYGSTTGVLPAPPDGAPAFIDGCKNPDDESGQPNTTLSLWQVLYGGFADEREFFVGMVDPSLPTAWGGLATGGTQTAWVRMNPTWSDTAPWSLAGAGTFAHEVGHLTGLKHVACADFDDDGVPDELKGGATDPSHPQEDRFPSCSLAEVREQGYYGFDAYWDVFGMPGPAVISNNPAAPDASVARPLLGYWGPKWIDPYHYCRLLVYYGVPCDPATIDEPFNPPTDPDGDFWIPTGHGDPPPNPGVPLLIAVGSVNVNARTAEVTPLLTVLDPPTEALERLERQTVVPSALVGPRLVARDALGVERYAVPIVEQSSIDVSGPSIDFNLIVPLDAAVATVAVEAVDGTVLATLAVSPNAPTGKWRTFEGGGLVGNAALLEDEVLVGFIGSDPDGDPLSATLLYSPDGERWQVVATGITGERTLRDELRDLPGSDHGRLRFIISDGTRATIAEGEPVVIVPNRAPRPWIVAPNAGVIFPLGAPIVLSGEAADPEDGRLGASQLRWTSSLDGALGEGRELRVTNLRAGSHSISLTATDADGTEASATIDLTVDGSLVAPVLPASLETAVSRIFDRLAAGEDPAPAPPASRASNPDFLWFPIALGALIVAVMIVVTISRLRSARRSGGTGQDVATLMDFEFDGQATGDPRSAGLHGQKDQDLTIENDTGGSAPQAGGLRDDGVVIIDGSVPSSAPDSDITVKGSKIKEN
ncbi:MAG: domain containing protein [Chloroflexi bacterium]|nr:domain containing protein [Chloroflexota bacterium]